MTTQPKAFHMIVAAALVAMNGTAMADVLNLKMAHQWPQDEADYVIATGQKFAQEVEKRSNGQIKITMFPAESLVKAAATHTALKAGSVDLAIYPYIYSAGAIPEMNMVLLPGLWQTHEDVFKFRKSEAWKKLEEKAENYGFKTLTWIQISGGVASTKKPIHVPTDVQGMKLRAAGKYMEYALQKAGATTVSMPSSENYSALQLGLLDGMWTSSGSFGAYRINEVAKYYVSPEDYSVYYTIEPIAISMRTWKKLTPDQQKILSEVGASLEQSALEGAKHEDVRVTKLFADKGVKVEKMTLDDWKKWQAWFAQHSFEKFKKDIPNGEQLLQQAGVPAK
ncbi:MAG TPA: TRAP transporter substrate-binding protein DctP [Noviherbaspirillum sp.]|uniref:TRAP transporter substrate-binding protein DctP n=1 Tax=Noviherbaspirillum sp. TaxID=1926288 RepID=UPI002B4981D5|nr:TRAP transporter substrate-binding protein DctP [Noviherbaspirillum sp.]HJV84974.1 TRAP transporter substrate-binding protein DctP [Noviherbaspirillum sp.]